MHCLSLWEKQEEKQEEKDWSKAKQGFLAFADSSYRGPNACTFPPHNVLVAAESHCNPNCLLWLIRSATPTYLLWLSRRMRSALSSPTVLGNEVRLQ
eukprot:43403-Pelagomonas_calceolata.AAC.4